MKDAFQRMISSLNCHERIHRLPGITPVAIGRYRASECKGGTTVSIKTMPHIPGMILNVFLLCIINLNFNRLMLLFDLFIIGFIVTDYFSQKKNC